MPRDELQQMRPSASRKVVTNICRLIANLLCGGGWDVRSLNVEALEYAQKTYGAKSAWKLSEESHEEPSWKLANEHRAPDSSVIMDYRLFFEGHPEAAGMLRLVEAQQEDRDAAEELATRRTAQPERHLAGSRR